MVPLNYRSNLLSSFPNTMSAKNRLLKIYLQFLEIEFTFRGPVGFDPNVATEFPYEIKDVIDLDVFLEAERARQRAEEQAAIQAQAQLDYRANMQAQAQMNANYQQQHQQSYQQQTPQGYGYAYQQAPQMNNYQQNAPPGNIYQPPVPSKNAYQQPQSAYQPSNVPNNSYQQQSSYQPKAPLTNAYQPPQQNINAYQNQNAPPKTTYPTQSAPPANTYPQQQSGFTQLQAGGYQQQQSATIQPPQNQYAQAGNYVVPETPSARRLSQYGYTSPTNVEQKIPPPMTAYTAQYPTVVPSPQSQIAPSPYSNSNTVATQGFQYGFNNPQMLSASPAQATEAPKPPQPSN